MESRNHFILQVRDKIVAEHGKDTDASFIFGLSGKWGEGKTTLLKELQEKLEKAKFKVIWINPWKFGDDKISFLRNFLKEIYAITPKNYLSLLLDKINDKNDFRDLYFDTTYKNVHFGYLVLLILLFAFASISYLFIIPQVTPFFSSSKELVSQLRILFALILAPFIIPLIGNVLTTQTSSKSVSTIDGFDKLLCKYLGLLKDKKIVVFIDDLDRVTPEVARNTLDNMRVFFDKSQLTFVVTGDHTVLERFIGAQTLPNSKEEEKIEEGRRYLKKVFNLYWRLPSHIDSEFDSFLTNLLSKNKTELNKIFNKEQDKKTFSKYLKLYFEKNFRHVIRFLDTVLFTFRIIEYQHEHAEDTNKKYFDQMLSNPLLVVRILMIQELCMPLFEAIIQDTGKLRLLEDAVEKKDTNSIDKIFEDITFTPNQSRFIRKFLYEEPRFFKNKRLIVYAFEPFLFLAADSSFGDASGLSKDDFIVDFKTGDPELVANNIQNCGDEKSRDAASAVSALFSSTVDHIEKGNYINTLSSAMLKIPDHFSQPYFIETLKNQNLAATFTGNIVPSRIQITQNICKWLDTQNDSETKEFVDYFPLNNPGEIDQFNYADSLGKFGSRVLCRWMRGYYDSNKILIIGKMEAYFPKLDKEIIIDEFSSLIDQFIPDLFIQTDPNQKDILYDLLLTYLPSSKEKLKELVFTKIKNHDEQVWAWAKSKTNDQHEPWTDNELENLLIDTVKASSTSDQLVSEIRFANGKIVNELPTAWHNLRKEKLELLLDSITQLSNEPLSSFVPDSVTSKTLFDGVIKRIAFSDVNTKISLLPSLHKKTFWQNLKEFPEQKIADLKNVEDPNLVREIDMVKNSWIPPTNLA